jgi:hypothetical protein
LSFTSLESKCKIKLGMKLNSRGSLLAEVVVASGIMGIVGLMTLGSMNMLRNQPNQIVGSNYCNAYLESAFSRLRRFGSRIETDPAYAPQVGHIYGSSGAFTPPMYSALSETWINVFQSGFFSTTAANNLQSIAMGATSYNTELNSAVQISGSVHLLQSIVRANANACTGITWIGSQLGTANSVFPAPSSDLMKEGGPSSFQLTMTIADGSPSCVNSTTRFFGPPGAATDANGNPIANVNAATPAVTDISTNIIRSGAIEVWLTANYIKNGQAQSCSDRERFWYKADITPPEHPTVTQTSPTPTGSSTASPSITNVLNPTASCVGTAYPGGVNAHQNTRDLRLELGFNSAGPNSRAEPGVAVFCKDVSYRPAGWENPCRPIPDTSYFFHNFPQTGLPPDAMGAIATPAGQGSPGRWTPCELVTLCGKRQNNLVSHAPYITNPTTTRNFFQSLSWSNLPYGCRARLRVIAVDTAGNLSATPYSTMFPSEEALDGGVRNKVDYGIDITVPQ